MKYVEPLYPDKYYHLFNRAVGSDRFFTCEEEYRLFLQNWHRYIDPVADTFAYCLIPNHFHFMIRVKEEAAICKSLKICTYDRKYVSRRFAGLFASYARIFNFRHHRMGKLFMLPFKRRKIHSESYFTQLIFYIHGNPVFHGLCEKADQWQHSSFNTMVGTEPTLIHRQEVLNWFNGSNELRKQHDFAISLKSKEKI